MPTTHRVRSSLALAGALLGALVAVSAPPAGAEGEGAPVKLQGKIKSVAADKGSIELQAKGATYQVSMNEFPTIAVLRAKKLGDFESGQVYILGKRHEAARDPGGSGKAPPQLGSICAFVVASAPFTPPPVPADLAERKIGWYSGALVRRGEMLYNLTDMVIQGGRDRPVVEIDGADRDAIVKGAIVSVEALRPDEGKPKDLSARRVVVVDPAIPAADLKLVLGW